MSGKSYRDLYPFSYPLVAESGPTVAFEHKDGAVSVAVKWGGIDYEAAADDSSLSGAMSQLYRFFAASTQYPNLFVEFHSFRGLDPYWSEKYYQYGEENFRSDRNPEMAKAVRRSIADHYALYSRHTDLYIVFTMKPRFGLFSRAGKGAAGKLQAQLMEAVEELTTYLDSKELRLLNVDEYRGIILRANNPALCNDSRTDTPYNYRFDATFGLIKPVVENGCLKTQGIGDSNALYHRVITLLDYPDARQNWQEWLSRHNAVRIHTVQISRPLDAQLVTNKSAMESARSSEAANLLGGESIRGKLEDHAGFRHFVTDNNLTIHANTFVIVVSDTSSDSVNSAARDVVRWFNNSSAGGGIALTGDPEHELHYYRIATPGCGYQSPYLREDHQWQVANMTPCFAQSHADMTNPVIAYLTSIGTVVGHNYSEGGVHHGLCAAKTGSGKTVTMAAEIAQAYPLGINFYITEVGRGYEFIVKAFGGEYHVLNADDSVISPFASYSEMDSLIESLSKDQEAAEDLEPVQDADFKIPATAVTTMRAALLPILAQSVDEVGKIHYESALDDLIQILYLPDARDPELTGPTLQTLEDMGSRYIDHLDGLQEAGEKGENPEKVAALKTMISNLHSFLNTAEGEVFKQADTIDFSSGLIGIDFGELISGNANNLAKYLLIFTATRLKQLAMKTPEQTFLIYDEDHEYTAIDQKLMSLLKSQVLKRGRKHAGYLRPISQEVKDIAYSEDGTVNQSLINQMSNYWLMFYGTDHEDLPSVFKLPKRAADAWINFRDPLAVGSEFNYRQAVWVRSGSFWNLYLSWPKLVSDLTNSDPAAVHLKIRLIKEEKGDFNRAIERFANEYRKSE